MTDWTGPSRWSKVIPALTDRVEFGFEATKAQQ
jgi:hypothetical protein